MAEEFNKIKESFLYPIGNYQVKKFWKQFKQSKKELLDNTKFTANE
ncbi:MAG: hypothetical protein QNJ53_22085 [Pleurocapsa sp. MO_192.B19]|nr:hypothetical protein [Pleurocapsa sp. MO_192.B19]